MKQCFLKRESSKLSTFTLSPYGGVPNGVQLSEVKWATLHHSLSS